MPGFNCNCFSSSYIFLHSSRSHSSEGLFAARTTLQSTGQRRSLSAASLLHQQGERGQLRGLDHLAPIAQQHKCQFNQQPCQRAIPLRGQLLWRRLCQCGLAASLTRRVGEPRATSAGTLSCRHARRCWGGQDGAGESVYDLGIYAHLRCEPR